MQLDIREVNTFKLKAGDISRLELSVKRKLEKRMNQEVDVIKKKLGKVITTKQSKGRAYRSRKGGAYSTSSSPEGYPQAGVVSDRGKTGNIHYASKPGFPPNEDTGDLRRGIWSRSKVLPHQILSIFGIMAIGKDGADYASKLEFGHGKVAPRPFFRKTVLKAIKSKRYAKAFRQIHYLIRNEIKSKSQKVYPGKGRKIV